MTVTQITNQVLFGSTTDTRPTAGIAANTLYFEIDSGRVYKFTGGVWSLFSGDNKPETLTNKTLTTPIISSIKNGSATISLPTITDTLVGRNTPDTLSNKILLAPTITTINNGGVVTLPSGTRTLVARDTLDTLLNKTINVNANSLIATSQLAGDILVNNGTQFIRLAKGSTGQFLISTASTLAWSSIDSTTTPIANIGNSKYLIFKSGSTTYLRNNITGAIDASSSTTPETVFQTALSAGGSIFVTGTHNMSNSFTGINFPVEPITSSLIGDSSALVTVPSGYSGYVFKMAPTSSQHCSWNVLSNIQISEAGTQSRNWEGIRLQGTATSGSTQRGVFHNKITDMKINYPNIGIRLYVDSTGTASFINDNFFERNLIYGAKSAFVDFDIQATYTPDVNGFYRNRFLFNTCQTTNGTDATYGFKNIRHKDNVFIGSYVADFSGSQVASNIHTDAKDTIIIGGSMDGVNYSDASTTQTTKRITENAGYQISRISPGQSGTNLDVVPTGSTNTWSWWNSTKTERFYIQKDATQYLFDFTKQTGGTLRPAVFRMNDASSGGAGATESFRIDTDAKLKVKNSKLYIRDSDESHGYTIIPGNLTADRNLSLPAITANDTIITANNLITDKTLLSKDVLFGRTINGGRKWGLNQCAHGGTPTWEGILGSASIVSGADNPVGMTSGQLSTTEGRFVRWATKTATPASGDNGGWRVAATVTCRAWNPMFYCRFKLAQTTDTRMWVGVTSDLAADPTGDDTLNGKSGVLFGIGVANNTAGTGSTVAFQMMHNDGTGVTVNDTVAVANTSMHTIEIVADDTNSKFQYSFDSGAYVDILADIPAPGTALTFIGQIETSAAAQKTIDFFNIFVTSDK